MKRLFRESLPAMSLLLCAAVVALWARASGNQDAAFYHTRHSTNGLFSGQGRIVYHRAHNPRGISADRLGLSYQHLRFEPTRWFIADSLGFALGRTARGATTYTGLAIPYWFIMLLLLIAPSRSLVRRQRIWRRRRLNLCLHCGYDLRASLDRCPECGTPALDLRQPAR